MKSKKLDGTGFRRKRSFPGLGTSASGMRSCLACSFIRMYEVTLDSCTRQINAERLKMLCDRRDAAVAEIEKEIDCQSGKTRTASAHSYSITSPAVSRSPKKVPRVTLEEARNELARIRRAWELEQQLDVRLSRVMSEWRDPFDCRLALRQKEVHCTPVIPLKNVPLRFVSLEYGIVMEFGSPARFCPALCAGHPVSAH
jgi:hypothetical protein